MPARVRVTTNNDIAYIWWTLPSKITGALGFSIHREVENAGRKPLLAWVGFEKGQGPKRPRDTDVWPIQSFQWKDVLAPREGRFRYHVYVVKGTPQQPVRDTTPILTSDWASLQEQFGKVRVVFNRGLLSTQALNRGSNAPAKTVALLRKAIATKDDKVRLRLTRELLPTMHCLLQRVKTDGGNCYAALYELTDPELIAELTASSGTKLLLSNANSSKMVKKKNVAIYDGTNKKVRQQLHKAQYGITDRMLKGNRIGHNKFVIYEDSTGPHTVLTGSANWTPTGLCGQTNNAVLIENRDVAGHYHEYWTRLQQEKKNMLQDTALRDWARTHPLEVAINTHSKLKVWFSPNTKRRTKSEKESPADLTEVFDIIDSAKSAVLFLLFNPGKPSILERLREAEEAKTGTPLYIRGAISDARTAADNAVRVYSRSAKKADKVVTGVAGVPDDFGYWERELLKLGHSAIHDKVLVVDPFSPDCVVITGSHNLGYKASFANDENMIIIRGHQPIAEAFATHILDVVNHYKWRYKLQEYHREGRLKEAWQDLEDDDRWQNKYFDTGFLASRDAFVLP